ncbi:MAG: phospho-sugar mutase [Clostridiales bacterium]|nr:phospho-sugar mutase [Clostridiales bacterium]
MNEKENYQRWLRCAVSDEDLQQELREIAGKDEEIEDRFYRELAFGTGGLRGVIGAGTNRMNVYVVGKATQGYCQYLKNHFEKPAVAVAYDSRIKSDLFARTAAGVFAANGIPVYMYPKLMPTPSLSFAVRHFGCSGGIVVTASHNPSKYNGYKVYGPDGCQITTQAASDILACIGTVDPFDGVANMPFEEAVAKGIVTYIGDDTVKTYLDTVSKESLLPDSVPKDIAIAYTPLNGTGISCVPQCLTQNGFTNISIPKEQGSPDGRFPTCPFPNPEIREALAVAIRHAGEVGAELVLATDPDCDRVGAAVKVNDEYVLISGNQMGVLLLDFVCRMRLEKGSMPQHPVAVKTIVTTKMAEKVAAHYGMEIVNVLTGFKFIGEQIGLLEKRGEADRYIFGFEESYGYLSSTAVRDKDGVNASLLICEMFAWYKAQGKTLLDGLQMLYDTCGCYTEKLLSFAFEGSAGFHQMQGLMASLRRCPIEAAAGMAVETMTDYLSEGTGLPKSDVVQLHLTGGTVATVRPSGTEPKLKIYLSACGTDCTESAAVVEKLEKYFTDWIHDNKNCT